MIAIMHHNAVVLAEVAGYRVLHMTVPVLHPQPLSVHMHTHIFTIHVHCVHYNWLQVLPNVIAHCCNVTHNWAPHTLQGWLAILQGHHE